MATIQIRKQIFLALLASFVAATATAQEQSPVQGLHAVPSNAAAYAHIDLAKFVNSPGLAVPAQIATGVKQEADTVFEKHFGVRISDLQSVSYVLPTFESITALKSNGSQTGFGLFAFANPINEEAFAKARPRSWQRTKIGSRIIYIDRHSGMALFQSSPTIIALGSESGVRWFLKFRTIQSENGLRPTMQLSDYGQITIGFNGDVIPAAMKAVLPAEYENIVNATSAGISLNFEDGTAARVQMNFDDEQDAAGSIAFAKANIEKLLDRMKLEESTAEIQLESSPESLQEALQPLSMLAMARFGEKVIRSATFEQTGTRLDAHVEVKGFDGHMITLICLSAIQAVGTSAEADFQAIANDLDAANAPNAIGTSNAEQQFEDLSEALETE